LAAAASHWFCSRPQVQGNLELAPRRELLRKEGRDTWQKEWALLGASQYRLAAVIPSTPCELANDVK